MKKVNRLIYLNFAACLFGLAVFLVCVQFVSCKKETVHANDTRGRLIDSDFEDEDVDEESENVEDISEDAYQTEAALKIDSVSATRATAENDAVCVDMPYKYAGYVPVGKGSNKATLIIRLTKNDSVLTSVTSNRDTSLSCSNLTRIDSTHYRFDVTTISNYFKAKSVTFSFKRSVNGIEKVVKKAVKMVDKNSEGKLYGTALHGMQSLGFAPSPNGTVIDSNYIPAVGDVVMLQDTITSKTQWCAVLTNPTIAAPKYTSGVFIPAVYRFRVIQFNSNCKGGTTKRYVKAYKKDMPYRIQNKERAASVKALMYFR